MTFRNLTIVLITIVSLSLAACGSSEENSCSSPSDCESGERCINGNCVSISCTSDLDCLGGEYCSIATGYTQGTCLQKVTDGDSTEADDGSIIKNCVDGVYRCRGDIREVCQLQSNVYDWRFLEECEAGCSLGKCNKVDGDEDMEEEENPVICTAGHYRCYDNVVQICSEDGKEWRLHEACVDASCIEQAPDAYCGLCYPGMRDCYSDNIVQVCSPDGTQWQKSYCNNDEACLGGACISDESCSPGRYNCNGTSIVEKCNDSGTAWEKVDTCGENETCVCGTWVNTQCAQAGCDSDPICSPFIDTKCSGDTLQRCNALGTDWANWDDCSDNDPPQTCVNGACQ